MRLSAWKSIVLILAVTPFGLLLTPLTAKAAESRHSVAVPLTFERNDGQADPQYKFLARHGNVKAMFSSRGTDLIVPGKNSAPRRVGMRLLSGSPAGQIGAELPLPGRANYLRGRSSAGWLTGVPTFARLRYPAIYPGIDLVFHGDQSGSQLEHDFVVAAGADAHTIRFAIDGADGVTLGKDGDLAIKAGANTLMFQRPVAYQGEGAGRRKVAASFRLTGRNNVAFTVGTYDHALPLIIDPVLHFSTYLDGTGADHIKQVAVDSTGNIYAVGATTSLDFPVAHAVKSKLTGDSDAFIAKLDPTGHTLLYSTYLGGSDNDEIESAALDKSGNIVVSGTSASSDFPQAGKLSSASNGNTYNFIASLDPTGATLRYSGFLGTTTADDIDSTSASNYVAFDGSGNAYIAGNTDDTAFPLTPGAYGGPIKPYPANETMFVAKIGLDGTVLYAADVPETASLPDVPAISPAGIDADSSGDAIVAGTAAQDLPTTPGSLSPADPIPGGQAGFVLKLNSTGSALVFSTYLTGTDGAAGVAVDGNSDIYVAGATSESTLPVGINAFQAAPVVRQGPSKSYAGYVLELSSDGSKALSATYFGGTTQGAPGSTAAYRLALDAAGNVVFGGATGAGDLPLKGPFTSIPDLSGLDYEDSDLFVAELSGDLSKLLFGSYLEAADQASLFEALATGPAQHIIVAGVTRSTAFPTTPGSVQPTAPGNPPASSNNFIADIDLAGLAPSLCFDTTNVNLGSQALGTTANSVVNITNCGNGNLTLSSVVSSDPAVVPTDDCSGIAPGATCKLQLAYTPTSVVTKSGTVTINGNIVLTGQKISFTGQGTSPIALLPTSLVFSDILVGQTGSTVALDIDNNGNGAFTLNSATITGDFQITKNECAAPLAPDSFCLIYLNFSPTALGARTGVLTLTDNLVPSVQTIALQGNGLATAPAPVISQVPAIPQTPGVGAIIVQGSGFMPNSVISWNGSPRKTYYYEGTIISADSNSGDLQQLGEAKVTISTPGPGGGTTSASTATVYGRIKNVQLQNEVYDPNSKLIYATTNKASATDPDSVIAIDPAKFQIVKTILTGNTPDGIAISDDGSLLYVGLDATVSVAQIALPSGTVNFTVPLPVPAAGTSSTPPTVPGLKVVPGQAHTWIVPLYSGIAVYDDAKIRPTQASRAAVNSFVFVNDPTVVYATYALPQFSAPTVSSIYAYKITTGGIAEVRSNQYVGGGVLESDGTLIYVSNGQVVDPATLTVKSTYPEAVVPVTYYLQESMALDAPNHRVFFGGPVPESQGIIYPSDLVLTAVDQASATTIGQIEFYESPYVYAMERFGSNGIFIDDGSQLFFLQTSLTGATVPVLTLDISPTSLAFGSQQQGTTSAAQVITLKNTGTGPITFGSILAVNSGFATSSTCGPTLAVSTSCTLSVTYSPTTLGDSTGAITIYDDAPNSPQTIALTGTGIATLPPIGVAPGASGGDSVTVAAGSTATYNLTVTTGTYSGTVNLSCSGAPQYATCSISPQSPNVTAGTATAFKVTVTTEQSQSAAVRGPQTLAERGSGLRMAGLGVLALCGLPLLYSQRRRARSIGLLILLAAACTIGSTGCGGGGSSQAPPPPQLTPAGTYTLTITAAAGAQSSTEKLTLIVN